MEIGGFGHSEAFGWGEMIPYVEAYLGFAALW